MRRPRSRNGPAAIADDEDPLTQLRDSVIDGIGLEPVDLEPEVFGRLQEIGEQLAVTRVSDAGNVLEEEGVGPTLGYETQKLSDQRPSTVRSCRRDGCRFVTSKSPGASATVGSIVAGVSPVSGFRERLTRGPADDHDGVRSSQSGQRTEIPSRES
jgi:hypothetical protein